MATRRGPQRPESVVAARPRLLPSVLLPLARLDAARNHKSAPGHRLSRIHCHASFDETFDSLQRRERLDGSHKDQLTGVSQNSLP